MEAGSIAQDMAFLDREFVEVVRRHFHVCPGHDLDGAARLDALFSQGPLREIAQADFRNVSVMLAAWVGETVRALAAGGRWSLDEQLGPCIIEVPGVPGAWRVLSRAEKRIRGSEAEVLLPFVARAVKLRS